jgi:hypothetical protein
MLFDARRVSLPTLNTLTKYPSIPTFHTLNPANGRLAEPALDFPDGATVVGTEKIDGTNARIVFTPDGGYFLGSREELLHFRGDVVANPALGIVEALKPTAERLADSAVVEHRRGDDNLFVLFLEVYGGRVTGGSKQYTGERAVGFRLFDVAMIGGAEALLALNPAQASVWRDEGGQAFAKYDELEPLAGALDVSLVPELFRIEAASLPGSVEDTSGFLSERLSRTLVALDTGAGGQPEGIVGAESRSSRDREGAIRGLPADARGRQAERHVTREPYIARRRCRCLMGEPVNGRLALHT